MWKPAPLPIAFHASLESGNWLAALKAYYGHQFHAPPVDTFELLKMVMHKTGVKAEDVESRFETKIRMRFGTQKRAIDQVDWATFWHALNSGDSRVISHALDGAKIQGVMSQTGVAEACAVLLKSQPDWQRSLIDEVPFSSVTKNNLLTVSLECGRWDVAVEFLQHAKFSRGDVMNVWPLVSNFSWSVALSFVLRCSKQAVSFDVVLPHLLKQGCGLQLLSEHLERANCLADPIVVAPLLSHAVTQHDWNFVSRAMEHLHDLGAISAAAHRVFVHLCGVFGTGNVVRRLRAAKVELHEVTVEALEELAMRK